MEDNYLFYFNESLPRQRIIPTRNSIDPWPMSPNISPNIKGNVTTYTTAGFAS
jgi:hypothetical protein